MFSIGTALAPNLPSFFVFRILTAFQGTAFLIVGASCIGDIYRPVSAHGMTFTSMNLNHHRQNEGQHWDGFYQGR